MNQTIRFWDWDIRKKELNEKMIVIIDDNKFKAQFYLEKLLEKIRNRLKRLQWWGIIKDIKSPASLTLTDKKEVKGLAYSRKTIKNALRFLRNI